MHSEWDEYAKRQTAGEVLCCAWSPQNSPCSHSQLPDKQDFVAFSCPAMKMRVQLHSRIMLSVDISATITGILPWFPVDVVDTECT